MLRDDSPSLSSFQQALSNASHKSPFRAYEGHMPRTPTQDTFGTTITDCGSDMSIGSMLDADDSPSSCGSLTPRSLEHISLDRPQPSPHVETALTAPDAAQGQPLIVPPREGALTARGNFSYVEVIGSMVLFVESTLAELIVRDGGVCILDRCTVTDALADQTDSTAHSHAAIHCAENSSVEIRACAISSANIGIKCEGGVVRCLWSTIKSRCGVWVDENGAALVTKCTFTSSGKDFVSQGSGLYLAHGDEQHKVRLLAQAPGAIRPYPCNLGIVDADGPCFSSYRMGEDGGRRRIVPDDYPTLQEALDASHFGDTVELLCFVRGPVIIPPGVRLFGGSIESNDACIHPLVTLKPFALLEGCDVTSSSNVHHTAVYAMRGALVMQCYIRNKMGVGVVCERGASVCYTNVIECHTGIVMEENSVWCFRNVVRGCRVAGIVAANCLVEENRLAHCRLSATSCHVLNNVAGSAWCANSAVARNKFGAVPSLVNCVDSEVQLKDDGRNISSIVESGNALMRRYDKAFGILPLDSCIPPPIPPVDDYLLRCEFNFKHHCPQEIAEDVSVGKRESASSGGRSPPRRVTLEYYERLMQSRRTRKKRYKTTMTPPMGYPDADTVGETSQWNRIPADTMVQLDMAESVRSNDDGLQKPVGDHQSIESNTNNQGDKPSFQLQRLRWALYSVRRLQGADMFLLPCAIQAKQWSNGHKGVEQSFINPPTTCHFLNAPLNSVECGFILLEAIKQGLIDKELLASALGREQHSRLRVTFTRMWASAFVKEEWLVIQRSAAERAQGKRRPLRELFGIQRESKGKVAATFFIAAMRSFFSRTLRMAGVEADSVMRLVEDFGRALAKSPEFCHHFDQCILPPAERKQYENVEDVIFALAYAVIMLNTSLHNKSTNRPMGKQEFITFGEQTHSSKDILRYVYKKIKEKEL